MIVNIINCYGKFVLYKTNIHNSYIYRLSNQVIADKQNRVTGRYESTVLPKGKPVKPKDSNYQG